MTRYVTTILLRWVYAVAFSTAHSRYTPTTLPHRAILGIRSENRYSWKKKNHFGREGYFWATSIPWTISPNGCINRNGQHKLPLQQNTNSLKRQNMLNYYPWKKILLQHTDMSERQHGNCNSQTLLNTL